MDIEQRNASAVLYTSDRDIILNHADGVYIWDINDKKYLDFAGAIAVNALGNANKKVINALYKQMQKLGQTSLSHTTQILEQASRKLIDLFDTNGKVFWSNSGAEANETAIKAMYYYQHSLGRTERDTIISFEHSFHGRTMRTLAASGKYMEGMGPIPQGFKRIEYNNIKVLENAIDNKIAGILVEPLQGEGGIIVPSQDFMNSLKILADKHDIVLCFDEVQCGIGRTGQFFCWQNFGVKPDIITLAKALSGGIFPVATTLMNEKIAHAITHNQTQKFNNGSTFGGNPLAATAVLTTIELLLEKDNPFLSEISAHNAAYLHEQLIFLEKKYSHIITEIRGIGFMKGIQLSNQLNNITIVNQLRQSGLFTMPAGDNVIRLVPPLNISKHHIDEAINLFQKVFSEM